MNIIKAINRLFSAPLKIGDVFDLDVFLKQKKLAVCINRVGHSELVYIHSDIPVRNTSRPMNRVQPYIFVGRPGKNPDTLGIHQVQIHNFSNGKFSIIRVYKSSDAEHLKKLIDKESEQFDRASCDRVTIG